MLRKIGFTKFIEYIPVDFSLWAKLKKSSKGFEKLTDYFSWYRVSKYHIMSKFKRKGHPITSSYVLYAIKSIS